MPHDAASERLDIPLLPLKNVVVFPRTIVNLTIGRARSINAVNLAAEGDHRLVVVALKDGEQDDPTPEDLYSVGTLVEVKTVRRQPDATLQVEVEALRRVKIESIRQDDNVLSAQVDYLPEKAAAGRETTALMNELAEMFTKYAGLNNKVPTEAPDHIRAARQPGYLADLLAAHLISDVQDRQAVLEKLN